jgi:hypothetical protein
MARRGWLLDPRRSVRRSGIAQPYSGPSTVRQRVI